MEHDGAGLRSRARVRGRQHVVGHRVRAVLNLHGTVSVFAGQLHRLHVHADRKPGLHVMRPWLHLLNCRSLNLLLSLPAFLPARIRQV